MSGGTKVVCVTGASGYIGSWLVKLLLQRGYTVRATVRDPNDPKKTQHLLSLDGATERLHLFKAGLLEEGAFDPVIDGCVGVFHVKESPTSKEISSSTTQSAPSTAQSAPPPVPINKSMKYINSTFHTASPVQLSATDPQAEIVEPAVKGTLNVLKSCVKFPTVKRVVLTSSMSSVSFSRTPITSDMVFDETWYSDALVCEQNQRWYPLSKILAEEAAWKFAKENGIDLVSMNPGIVIGPLLQPTLNGSVELIANIISGIQTPFLNYTFVDVRDVASAHIQAFEVPSANGRYCLVGQVADGPDTLQILRQLYPTLCLPELGNPSDSKYQVSKEKAKSLGINFLPLEASLRDTIESLKEKGFLNI